MRLWLRTLTGHAPRGFEYFESAVQFRRTLDRERMRVDRSFSLFSLVEFAFDPTDRFEFQALRLEAILKHRLRATDVVGLLAGDRIGVMLPETPADGAQTVVRDVRALWGSREVRLLGTISVYSAREIDEPDAQVDGSADRLPGADRRLQPVGASGRRTDELSAQAMSFVKPLPPWKRALDICGACMGLLLLAPLLFVVSGLIRVSSGRPILFRQQRSGLGGRPFLIYKFRTMSTDAELRKQALRAFSEQDGPAFKLKSDPRITKLGRYLRKSSIDELPQLWNVLKGEMTLVGPRPLPCDESAGCTPWQLRRLDVTPGLTCIWQVEGKSRVSFAEWMRMDLRYMKQRTPWHDARLIARTLLAVVAHRASH